MAELESSYNAGLSTNNAGFTAASALQIRLDPSPVIESIELFLRGAKIVVNQETIGGTQELSIKRVDLGERKANDLGIQGILNWVQSIFNPQVVQANFAVDSPKYSSQYAEYIRDCRINLAETMLENFSEWDLKENDLNYICNFIMNIIEPFLTRGIDNKERDSYMNTVTHNESSVMKEGKSSILNMFGGK